MLPADGHVHSEWSWDAEAGSMLATCERAVRVGLPAVAFTEHADYTVWTVPAGGPGQAEQRFTPPPLDVEGYLASLHLCRERFPGLRVVTGVELSEPHWHPDAVAGLLRAGPFDRVLGSVHSVRAGADRLLEPRDAYGELPAGRVVRDYLAEAARMAGGDAPFAVLAHIDYPVRGWPGGPARHDPADFEEDYRAALRALAGSGRALEFNTVVPLHPVILRWWHEEGGDAVSFGSDAHRPEALAAGLAEAADLAESCGFRPGRHPYDLWGRA
jgi:histidinol-phosphatase (PHP family)